MFFGTSLCRVGSSTENDPDQVIGHRLSSLALIHTVGSHYMLHKKPAVSPSEKYSHST